MPPLDGTTGRGSGFSRRTPLLPSRRRESGRFAPPKCIPASSMGSIGRGGEVLGGGVDRCTPFGKRLLNRQICVGSAHDLGPRRFYGLHTEAMKNLTDINIVRWLGKAVDFVLQRER